MSEKFHVASRGAKTAAAQPRRRSLWLINGPLDLILLVATPLLILPVVLSSRGYWSDEEIILFVAAFGQLGHQLPGMLRAYGDRALFQRYRNRFLFAPLTLIVICVLAMRYNLHGLILISVMWAIWHALMQTYGFVRIYDAKVSSRDKVTRRLDFAMCLFWFGGAILLADRPLALMLEHFYGSGGPLLSASLVSSVQTVWLAGMVLVTSLFLANMAWATWRGRGPSPIKLLLMATSFGFYWFAYAVTPNILVGAAMFELFHDVQYLTIVWMFNRNRAAKDPAAAGSFVRFLFRRSWVLVGIYVGMVFAFGGLRYFEYGLAAGQWRDMLAGILAASGLLHYYYDGFIWKMRDPATSESLGVKQGQGERPQVTAAWQPRLAHGLKWALFVIPLIWLAGRQAVGVADAVPRYRAIVQAAPGSFPARVKLAAALSELELTAEAMEHWSVAVQLDPLAVETRLAFAETALEIGRYELAEQQLRKAARLRPEDADVHNLLGIALARQHRFDDAERAFREVVRIRPDYADAHYNLGNVLGGMRRLDEASTCYRRALQLRPNYAKARLRLQQTERRMAAES